MAQQKMKGLDTVDFIDDPVNTLDEAEGRAEQPFASRILAHGFLTASRKIELEHTFKVLHEHVIRLSPEGRRLAVDPPTLDTPRPQLDRSLEKYRVDTLLVENENLKTRLSEEKARLEELREENNKLHLHIDSLLGQLSVYVERARDLVGNLFKKETGQLLILERYKGYIQDFTDDSITVVYNVDGDVEEHTYEKRQLLNPHISRLSGDVVAYAIVSVMAEHELLEERKSMEAELATLGQGLKKGTEGSYYF